MSDPNLPFDLFDALRAANPYPNSDPVNDSPETRTMQFQEITMSDHDLSRNDLSDANSSGRDFGPAPSKDELMPRRKTRSGRRLAITGVAAASAVVVGFGAVALIPGNTTAAEAAVVNAAQATEASDSGSAIITIVADGLDEAPLGAESLVLSTVFSGADLSARLDGDQAASFGFGGAPEVRVVDGVIYLNIGDGSWYSVDDPNIATILSTIGLPVDIRNDLSTGIADLVKSASNVEELGADHYRATVTVEEAQRLADAYPSLGLYTDRLVPAELAQQELDVDLVLDAAGLIDVVTIGATVADPEDATVSVSGSISIDFNDLGTDQAVVAPEGARSLDLGTMLGGN